MIDLRPTTGKDGAIPDEVEIIYSVVSGFDGETPDQALRGLGFARTFALADSTHFDCVGLLKLGGLTIGAAGDPDTDALKTLVATGSGGAGPL